MPEPADHAAARPTWWTRSSPPSPNWPPCSRTTPGIWTWWPRISGRWADGGFGVPDFLDSLLAFQPQLHRTTGCTTWCSSRCTRRTAPQPLGRGRPRGNHLAGLHRRPGGRALHEPAVRADALPGLHPRLRHQLGGALPRDGVPPRNPHLHLGRHLPGPGGGTLPPRPAAAAETTRLELPPGRRPCSRTRPWPRRRS